jgi:hypothetical protein
MPNMLYYDNNGNQIDESHKDKAAYTITFGNKIVPDPHPAD